MKNLKIATCIYVGLNDQTSNQQIIPTIAARDLVINTLFNYGIECATITECVGAYKYNNGRIARENTISVEIIQTIKESRQGRKKIDSICESLKKQLNQECIAIKKQLVFFNCR